MDAGVLEPAVKLLLEEMHGRLEAAAAVAKAARVCAESGSIDKAVEIALDVEQLTYEAGNLLNAASTVNRIHNKRTS